MRSNVKSVELVAPAGNVDKLSSVLRYGADAAYLGLMNFSLRSRSENFYADDIETLTRLKGDKKLYGAINIYFSNADVSELERSIETIGRFPIDAFIVSDLGAALVLQKAFPDIPLHLSTQANCVNSEAAKKYRDLGFKRVILGRELKLEEIAEIKRRVEDLELEVFVHGAMCIAYSGRCYLSSYMAGRSANRGDCAHSCRWAYRMLEEQERLGETFPVDAGRDYFTVLSSKDLCMVDHLPEVLETGIDAVKIEGRMKSEYYAAIVTRTYRKMLDAAEHGSGEDLVAFRKELHKVSRREYTTGFFFGDEESQKPTKLAYAREYTYIGRISEYVDKGLYRIDLKNQLLESQEIEYIGPEILFIRDDHFKLFDENKNRVAKADHGKVFYLRTEKDISPGYLVRRSNESLPDSALRGGGVG